MKKKYSTPNLIKAVSLSAAMATLLSSVSPVFAAGVAITGGLVQYDSGPGVPYRYGSHGSIVFAGDNDFCGVDNVEGRGGEQQKNLTNKITAEDQYNNFINNQADNIGRNPYGTTTEKVTWQSSGVLTSNGAYMGTNTGGSQNILPEAYGVYSFVTGCGAAATGNYSTAFGAGATTKAGGAQAFGVAALASGRASVAMGVSSEASGESAVAVGGLANASGSRSIAIGVDAQAKASGAIAIGSRRSDRTSPSNPTRDVLAEAKNAIAIGTHTYGKGEDSVAIGANAQALVADGVAVGGASVSRRGKDGKGYDPATGKETIKTDATWKSTAGAFSVGDVGQEAANGKITRQITGVAAGKEDTDAVNVAQLKAMRDVIAGGGAWILSANDTDSTDIQGGSTVNFTVDADKNGNKNITIEKEDADNKSTLKFALNDNLKLSSVTTGESSMSGDGFIIENGPKMILDGIDAGHKQIINVVDGEEDTDAVNYKQLKDVKQIAENGWKLSVDGNNATDVKAGSTVNFSASEGNDGHKNIKIVGDNKRNVTFDLADDINVTTVTAGESIMDAVGFRFDGDAGPSITVNGIHAGNKTIKGVAAGEEDTDAVNFKQLKDFTAGMETGWKLSVDGKNATDVTAGSTVDLIAVKHSDNEGNESENTNIKIVKREGNKVSFDLNEYIKVGRVEAGLSRMSNAGFMIKDGPNMTKGGIYAGNTKITGVQKGINANDAVNVSQLNEIKNQIVENSLVKWKEDEKLITIGAQKDGTEIDITNKSGGNRTISGVKDGILYEDSTDAVNGSQLWNTNKKVDLLDKKADTISNTLVDLGETVYNIETKVNDVSEDAVRYDRDANGRKTNKITLKGDDISASVSITNVADGLIKSDSKDAINGRQINKILGDIANFFGGDAAFQDGAFVGPRYNLSKVSTDGTVFQHIDTNVGDALTTLDANVKNVNSRIKYVDNKFDKFSQDALLWDDEKKAFSARHKKDGRKTDSKITSLLNGDVTEDSTDAINGSQLYKMGDQIAKFFGGGSSYKNGEWSEPTFKISQRNEDGTIVEKKHHNVADAFEGVDNSITDIYNQINNVTENSLVKQEGKNGLITIGKASGGTEISIVNKDNQERILSGVKDGKLSITSTEAVNGSQLFKTKNDVKTVTDNLSKIAKNTSKYFGGSADVLEGIKPTFVIGENTYDNVTEAFTGVNTSITNIDNKIIEMKENSLVKQDEKSNIITIGKDTAGTEINIAGYGDSGRKISGVREAEKDDEAVNKKQLDKSIEKISKDIETASAAAVLYDKDEDGNVNYGSVTLGGDKNNGPVALHNVKDGSISQDSKDAINGSQINKISADIAKFFGGGASFENGAFKGPKYSLSTIVEDGQVAKVNYYNVGDALTGLDANVKSVNNRLTNVANNFNQTIEGISKDALLWDDEEQAFVARHEKDGQKTNSKLKYLLDGDISKGSTDAITGNQLYLMSNQLANYFGGGAKYENGKWTAPQFKIVQVDTNGNTVENKYNTVAEAFGGINQGMSNINNRIDDVINKVDSDALKWNSDKKAYDATHDGTPSKIINVADGKIEKGSKDAVNGGQLWQTNERVAKVENRVTDVENHVEIIDKKVDNISNTIEDIGDTVNNINIKVDNIDNKVNDIAEDAVRYDRDENGKKINKITLKGGDPSEPVLIDNVADGKIEKGSKEAVNGGQLHDYTQEQMKLILDESKHYTDQRVNNIVIDAIDDAVERSKQYTDMKFDALNYSIESVKKEARQAAAIGLAVSNLRYNDTPGKLSVGFGTGLWRSQSAFAFGAGYTSEKGNIRSNVSVTTSGGHWGVGAGFNMTLN